MANLRDKKKKKVIDPVERRRLLKEQIIQRNAEAKEDSTKKKKSKPLGQAQPGRMSAIKSGRGSSPLDMARQTRKGPAKY